MTSAVGGGRVAPKSKRKKQNQLICDNDRGAGEEVKKAEKFADIIYGSPLVNFGFTTLVLAVAE